jgi:hypothetical protein
VSFGRFVPLFRWALAACAALAAAPAAFRLRDQPRAAMSFAIMSGLCLRPGATLGDGAVAMTAAALGAGPASKVARRGLVAAAGEAALRTDLLLVAAACVVLGVLAACGPAAFYLWLVAATGNGNHAYFLGLAHCLAASVLVTKALAWHVPRRALAAPL